jgi:phosphonate transport system substrate-binding protein
VTGGPGVRAGRGFDRRAAIVGAGASCAVAVVVRARAAVARSSPVSFGLTPVFLDSDFRLIADLETYLARRLSRPVLIVKRRTYQEITALLVAGEIDAAWICGFPFVKHPDRLTVIAVPVYRGEPTYRSYLIARSGMPMQRPEDLRGGIHAFSDPDSNSGFLVTRHWLAERGETPDGFFRRTFFTYGHRNVIRAVASGLAHSGSVDGYVWDVMEEIHPELVERTQIVARSEPMGFPPVAAPSDADPALISALRDALLTMGDDPAGQGILATLRLDGFAEARAGAFDGIVRMWDRIRGLG